MLCWICDWRARSVKHSRTVTLSAYESAAGRPFDSNAGDSSMFPHSTWAKLLARSWRREGAQVAAAADWTGACSLPTAIANYVFGLRGMACKPEQIVIRADSRTRFS